MDQIVKLINWLRSLAVANKVLACIIALLMSIIVLFSCQSCGSTRAFARTSHRGVTTITITTNNPTSVDASPDVDVNLTPNL